MVMERFNALVFIGDDIARGIYLAFNMLLRENLALGGLQEWTMSAADREACTCDNQFLDDCVGYGVMSSGDIKKSEGSGSPYYCDRKSTAHSTVVWLTL
jgi:hypothetical protein